MGALAIERLRTPARAAVAIAFTALGMASFASTAHAAAGGNSNKGDVWTDNVGQPAGPGHEQDPHLACADINLWGAALADPSGTYTVDGWPPSGSQEQDYPTTGLQPWSYDASVGGNQILSVINVRTLIQNAVNNGDAPKNKQGFHFKLQFSQDPQKHKTFWVNCTAVPPPPPVNVWIQTLDSCTQTIGGASYALFDSSGNQIASGTATTGPQQSVPHPNGCPAQGGNCQAFTTGCISFSLAVPSSGTLTYRVNETAAPSGYAPCEGGSACQLEYATLVVDSTGAIQGTVTNVYPDGTVRTFPISDLNTGASFYSGTVTDPVIFFDSKLGTVTCDGDNDADDQNGSPPGGHCDNDGPHA
jgi:hypothetical protein